MFHLLRSVLPLSALLMTLACHADPTPTTDPHLAAAGFVSLEGTPLPGGNPVDPDGRIHAVTTPTLHLRRTTVARPRGTVLLFPGGGYHILAIDHEGVKTADFLNAQGFDVAILEYAIDKGAATRDLALGDALKAWRLLRAKASALGLHGRHWGVMGYSAGGHLAARLTSVLPAAEQPNDLMLIYPAYLDACAPGTRVPAVAPPPRTSARLFVLIAANDKKEWVESCQAYAGLWREQGERADLQVLADGGHGFGMHAERVGAAKDWPDKLATFLAPPMIPSQRWTAVDSVPQRGWEKRHEEKVALARKEKFDLIMVGDSITHNLETPAFKAVWDRYFVPRRTLNLGYSGARTENINWNIAHGELDGQSPKVITLMIGTNNADADTKHYPQHDAAPAIAAGIRANVAALRQKCPEAKILLLRCFPGAYGGPGPTSHRAALDKASELAIDVVDNQHVFFCDVNHVFLNLDGSIKKELMPDYLHPNAEGARQWAEAMEPMLAQLLGEAPIVPAVPVVNTAVLPVPKLEDDAYDWYARHADILKIKDAVDPEVVMLGDSITHFWGGEPKGQARGPQAWNALFADRRVLNLGYGWDRTQNVLWRLDHGELDGLHPRTVVVCIGTNNTSGTERARANTPAEICAGVEAICGRVRSKVPGVQIILTGILPREEKPDHPRRRIIAETNALLAAFAKSQQLPFVDLSSKYLAPDGTLPRTLMSDFCHPTEAGYRIWADALRPLLPPAVGRGDAAGF